jgi:hypothetical protein
MPTAASNAYSRNISALLQYLVSDGALAYDPSDEVHASVVITRDGRIVNQSVADLLSTEPEPAEPEPAELFAAGPDSEEGADVDGTTD